MTIDSFVRRYGRYILSGLVVSGTVITAVLTAKETPKAVEELKKAKEEKGSDLTALEKAKVTGPVYIPAIIVGTCTIACEIGAVILNKEQSITMASAYALLNQSYNEYKNKTLEICGEETANQIEEAIHIDHADCPPITACGFFSDDYDLNALTIHDKKDTVLFYDEYSKRFFESTMLAVTSAEYHLNRNFSLSGEVPVNMFYAFLGIDGIEHGDDYFFSFEYGYTWVDFAHKKCTLPNGREYYTILMGFWPEPIEFDC